jgi:hypothetical protein
VQGVVDTLDWLDEGCGVDAVLEELEELGGGGSVGVVQGVLGEVVLRIIDELWVYDVVEVVQGVVDEE